MYTQVGLCFSPLSTNTRKRTGLMSSRSVVSDRSRLVFYSLQKFQALFETIFDFFRWNCEKQSIKITSDGRLASVDGQIRWNRLLTVDSLTGHCRLKALFVHFPPVSRMSLTLSAYSATMSLRLITARANISSECVNRLATLRH